MRETPPQLPIIVLSAVTLLLTTPLALAVAKAGYARGGVPLAAGALVLAGMLGYLTLASARR